MAVAANDRVSGPFECTGGETLVPYDFRIRAAADLAVIRKRGGGQTRLVLGTDYLVENVGNPAGGNAVLLEPALAGDIFVAAGDRALARTLDLVETRAWSASALNAEWDSLQIQIQELGSKVARAIVRDRFGAAGDNEIPVTPGYLILDEAGDMTTVPGGPGGGPGGLEVPVTIEHGGTGGDTAEEARDNLGLGTLATKSQVTFAELHPSVAAGMWKVGDIKQSSDGALQAGWWWCDGGAKSRTGEGAALFAKIGTRYGAGDGSTTFNLPDFRGVVQRGVDGGAGRDAGAAPIAISNVANNGSGLIRITVGSTASLSTGRKVHIAGVGGVAAANGTFTITVISGTTFDLQGSAFSGLYTAGGSVYSRIPLASGGAYGDEIGAYQDDMLQRHSHGYDRSEAQSAGSGGNPVGQQGTPNETSTGMTGRFGPETTVKNVGAKWMILYDLALAAGAADTLHTIHSVSGAPSSGFGVDGDYAIDSAAQLLYGPKAAGAWPAGVNIKGLTGDKGDKGDSGAPGSATGYDYETRAALALANVPLTHMAVRTGGYSIVGKGASLFKRVSTPGSPGPEHVQSDDGAWWELVPEGEQARFDQFGALGDGITDDTTAINNCLAYCARTGITAFVPVGYHSVSTVVLPGQNALLGLFTRCRIIGAGPASVIIQNATAAGSNNNVLTIGEGVNNDAADVLLDNFRIECAASKAGGALVYAFGCSRLTIGRLWHYGDGGNRTYNGISLIGIASVHIQHFICFWPQFDGIQVQSDNVATSGSGLWIDKGTLILSPGRDGVRCGGGIGGAYFDFHVYNAGRMGAYITAADSGVRNREINFGPNWSGDVCATASVYCETESIQTLFLSSGGFYNGGAAGSIVIKYQGPATEPGNPPDDGAIVVINGIIAEAAVAGAIIYEDTGSLTVTGCELSYTGSNAIQINSAAQDLARVLIVGNRIRGNDGTPLLVTARPAFGLFACNDCTDNPAFPDPFSTVGFDAWQIFGNTGTATNYRPVVEGVPAKLTGTPTNDDAAAGQVGEYVSSSIPIGSAVALTSGSPADITSIALTAGDWDVWADAQFSGNASTQVNNWIASISTTSATLNTSDGHITADVYNTGTPYNLYSSGVTKKVGVLRVSLSGTTTFYLVAQSSFATSTSAAHGGIYARRRR